MKEIFILQSNWLNSHSMGVKTAFKRAGRNLLKKVASDLGLKARISFNPGGTAVSGDHTLMAMVEGRTMPIGIYISFNIDGIKDGILYRTIKHDKDFTGGINHFYPISGTYQGLVSEIKNLLGIDIVM